MKQAGKLNIIFLLGLNIDFLTDRLQKVFVDNTKHLSIGPMVSLRNKTCFPCLYSLVKTKANVWEISENPRRGRGVSPAREFSQTLPRFSTGYGG